MDTGGSHRVPELHDGARSDDGEGEKRLGQDIRQGDGRGGYAELLSQHLGSGTAGKVRLAVPTAQHVGVLPAVRAIAIGEEALRLRGPGNQREPLRAVPGPVPKWSGGAARP